MSYSLLQMRSELDTRKQNTIQLLVENEFRSKLEGGRRTLDEIADEAGVTRQSIYNWRKDPVFNAYTAYVSDQMLDSQRSFVDGQLMKLIQGTGNGTPSVKAIEMWYKLNNRLIERSVVETVDGSKPQLSDQEISDGIAELADKLKQ